MLAFNRAVAVAAVVASTAWAEVPSLTSVTDVGWDETGGFVVADMSGKHRYDVRTGAFEDLEGDGPDVAPLAASRTAPDGKAVASIKLNTSPRNGSWKAGEFTVEAKGDHALVVTRGPDTYKVAAVDAVSEADVYWSTNSQYVAFLVRATNWSGMDGSTSASLYVSGTGPRAQVLGSPALVAAARATVVRAVEKAGALVVYTGRAKKERATTTIYAAKGQEARARAIASALPGGGAVEPLTWDTPAELVVALGASVANSAQEPRHEKKGGAK